MNGASRTVGFAVAQLVAIALLTQVGCRPAGPPTAAVSGRVTLDGKPLAEGVIRFVPIDGTPGQKLSVPVADGKFAIAEENGPPVGTHRVEIESTDTGGLGMDDEDAVDRLRAEGKSRVYVVRVPRWYNTASTLRETLQGEMENVLSFELSSKRLR